MGHHLSKEELVELICRTCDFWKESEADLECGAYRILARLLEEGTITPEQVRGIRDALLS